MNASEKEDTEIDATKILSNSENAKLKKKKKKKVALNDADKCGVCYLSRIPPHMDHVKLRHILSQFGDIQRIFLALQDPNAQVCAKRSRGSRDQAYSE
ncbi:pre-rRNA-processing protein ESF2-like [Cajanus cajan]|uniref:pre-rRNA-processing protein ESF2-like n=1 Tax=Cajanus cajan TaxID=3821 RepID=UPI00098D7B53|nr:pre-rRNA-processing protein ESF2-like [Cajanus cajan]